VRHLVARFFRTLRSDAPTAADDSWATSMLTVGERRLFAAMGASDRRHAIDGARWVEAWAVERSVRESIRCDAVEAALVHDVGKRHAHLGVLGRSNATVLGWFVRSDGRRTALAERGGWPGRAGQYLRHDAVGAAEVAAADGSPLAIAWTAVHHDPSQFASLPAPQEVAEALDAADRDF
jgi:hypothetical protein